MRRGISRLVTRALLSGAVWLWACAESAPPPAPVKPPSEREAKHELKVLLANHDALSARIMALPADVRTECELGAGDCVVLVAERRGELTHRYGLHPCPTGTEAGDTCLLEQLTQAHQESAAAEYLGFKNWCFQTLLECVESTASKHGEQAALSRGAARRKKVETSAAVVEQWRVVEIARARVDYLRATLPPPAAKACALPEVKSCHDGITQRLLDLDAELGADDYDDGRAARTYAAIKKEEAGCLRPELYCLTDALKPFGLTPDAKKALDLNLAAIERRQKLAFAASEDAQGECLGGQEALHEDAIDAAFRAYAEQPLPALRLKLEKAYLTLHEAQIECLARPSSALPAQKNSGVIELD